MIQRNRIFAAVLFVAVLASLGQARASADVAVKVTAADQCFKKIFMTDKLLPPTITKLGSECEICKTVNTFLCSPIIETVEAAGSVMLIGLSQT